MIAARRRRGDRVDGSCPVAAGRTSTVRRLGALVASGAPSTWAAGGIGPIVAGRAAEAQRRGGWGRQIICDSASGVFSLWVERRTGRGPVAQVARPPRATRIQQWPLSSHRTHDARDLPMVIQPRLGEYEGALPLLPAVSPGPARTRERLAQPTHGGRQRCSPCTRTCRPARPRSSRRPRRHSELWS